MTVWKRIQTMFIALLQLLCVLLLMEFTKDGRLFVIAIMQIILVIRGIRYLVYYFTMARYMVNGKSILYRGSIYLNFGIYIGSLEMLPSVYLMVYLIGYFLFCGLVRCLKILDTRKVNDWAWHYMVIVAGWYLILAFVGIFHFRSVTVMTYLFCIEMTMSALAKILRVFRKTAIVYIQ